MLPCLCPIFLWQLGGFVGIFDQVSRETSCGFYQVLNPHKFLHFMSNDESKLLYGVEFWSTQWILTPSFKIPSSLIRSPFQGVHTIFCYKIMMDLGQREPCFNKSMVHLLQNPSVNATTRPCRIGGRSLSALKISCHSKSIRWALTENVVGWNISSFL